MSNSKQFSSVSPAIRMAGYGRLALLVCAIALPLAACAAWNAPQNAWPTQVDATPGVVGGL